MASVPSQQNPIRKSGGKVEEMSSGRQNPIRASGSQQGNVFRKTKSHKEKRKSGGKSGGNTKSHKEKRKSGGKSGGNGFRKPKEVTTIHRQKLFSQPANLRNSRTPTSPASGSYI